jgi:hypothetical protein
MMTKTLETHEVMDEKFPYRFLLRWTWPDHIDRTIRRLMWAWLHDQNLQPFVKSAELTTSDYVATQLFWLIAVSPDTPGAVLDALADSGSEAFLERIAENPMTWSSTLTRLAKHSSARVRTAVADNPNTAANIILRLSVDEDADIRYAVAENANQSVSILEALTEDDNCHVAARSQKTLSRLQPKACKQLPANNTGNKRKKTLGA